MSGATSLRDLAAGVGGETRAQRLYREDAWSWAQEQAGALRRRDVAAIDWENVIEEIETLGRSEEHAWTSLCTNVVSHLLKIEHSGRDEGVNHWAREIRGYRQGMYRRVRSNPGMKGRLEAMLEEAWEDGREAAVGKLAEYGSPGDVAGEDRLRRSWRVQLPKDCPYGLEDIAGYDPYDKKAVPQDDVWPASVARKLNEVLGVDYPVRNLPPERGSGRSR